MTTVQDKPGMQPQRWIHADPEPSSPSHAPLPDPGPMSRYPLGRYLIAMGLGRFPRYWFFAELGRRVGVPGTWLAAALALSLLIGLTVAWHHRVTQRRQVPEQLAPATV